MAYHELIAPLLGAFFVVTAIIGLAVYIYTAWALMTIAKKTGTEPAWLAWIPIANVFLMPMIAQMPWWTALIALVGGLIPFIGPVIAAVIAAVWWWKIADRLGYEEWMGILMIVPVVNLVMIGVFAWKEQ